MGWLIRNGHEAPVASAGCLGPGWSPLVLAAFAVVAFAALGMRGVSSATDPGSGDAQLAAGARSRGAAEGAPPEKRPNVVLILTDDLDKSLMPYMPNTTRLIRDQGASFDQLLRRAVQLLSLARVDPVRPLRAQPRRDRQRLARGRLRPLEADQAGRRPAGLAGAFRLPQRAARQVLQRVPLPPGQPPVRPEEGEAAVVRAAGLAVVGLAGAGERVRAEPLPAERRRDGRRGLPRGLPGLVARPPRPSTWSTAATASTSPRAGSSSTTRRTARTRRTPTRRSSRAPSRTRSTRARRTSTRPTCPTSSG